MTATTYDRRRSMSVAEAVEDIMRRSIKARHICARAFATSLIEQMPELVFWQFTPPDSNDKPEVDESSSKDLARQVWPKPVILIGHFVGCWLRDVYAGSRAAARYGNSWDEPHLFNYFAASLGKEAQDWANTLPMPLMRDFRANRDSMLTICMAAKRAITPTKTKSGNRYTPYKQEAINQISKRAQSRSDDDIDEAIRSFEHDFPSPPIHTIELNRVDPSIVTIEYEPTHSPGTETKEFKISTIRKGIRSYLNSAD